MGRESQELAAFIAGLRFDQIPGEVVTRLKYLILDMVGNAIRAHHDTQSGAIFRATADELGLAGNEAGVFATSQRYNRLGAAFLNAAFAHSLDFDDTHARASTHPGAPVIAAALATGQACGASGRELLTAIVAGYETHIRLSLGVVPREHYAKGHALTSTCGAFGASAAAASIYGLGAEQVVQAFGGALSQCAGTLQFLQGGGSSKPFQVGYGSLNGVFAATLARTGFVGPSAPIEGRHGFLNTFSGAPQPENVIAGLGTLYEVMQVGIKPYPACRYCHAGIDGVIALVTEHDIDHRAIESIAVGLPRTGWDIIGDPESEKRAPRNLAEGQFSMPFCAAVAAIDHGMTWESYSRHLGNSETLSFCGKVSTVVDERAEACFPANMSASVSIEAGGERYECFVEVPKGEPGNFVTEDALFAKFHGLADPYLGRPAAERLRESVMRIEEFERIEEAFAEAFQCELESVRKHPAVKIEAV